MAQNNADIARDSYDHVVLVAGRVAQANAPSGSLDYDGPEGGRRWTIMANERSYNLALAHAECARAVLADILSWCSSDEISDADFEGAEKVLRAYIQDHEAAARRRKEQADAFRDGKNPNRTA